MKKILFQIISFILALILIPYSLTMLMTGTLKTSPPTVPYDGRVIISENENYSQSFDYSQYLIGVTARMLITFDQSNFSENVLNYPEFVKMCCLLANTFLTKEFAGNATITDEFLQNYYVSDEDLKKLWGDNYNNNISIIATALTELNGQLLVFENAPATPYYHFISNGQTRPDDSSAYLKSVNTNEDLEENGFLAVLNFNQNDFIELVNSHTQNAIPKYSSLKDLIQITGRDDTGYVTGIQIGNVKMSGDAFAEMLNLNSPSFTITFQGDNLKIITKGIGHGYGISLTYAFRLARAGHTCTDIINYFYNNVEIKNLN